MSNRQYREMYALSPDIVKPGCTLEELMRHRKAVGVLAGEPEEHCRRIRNAVAANRDSTIRLVQADGRVINVLDRPIPGGGWITIHKDVTKEVKAEAELEETRNFLRTIIEQVPSSIIVKDARDFRYVLVNKAAEIFMNRPAGEIIGRTVHDVYPPQVAASLQALDEEILDARPPAPERPGAVPRGRRRHPPCRDRSRHRARRGQPAEIHSRRRRRRHRAQAIRGADLPHGAS